MIDTFRGTRIHETGGPEVLSLDRISRAPLEAGQVRVRVAFAGVNFIDVYHRTGLYPAGDFPARIGREGSGVVAEIGAGVERFREGDRVAFFDVLGAYAEEVVVLAARALALPDELSFEAGAALPIQGMTADVLVRTIGRVAPGDVVLVHAAAGGVGRLAVQLAKAAGARVFGTCSSEEKAAIARAAGCDEVLRYTEIDFAAETLRLTGGRGADLVLDSVGRATFAGTVRATRVRGKLVLYGQSSGLVEPFSPRPVLGSRTLVTATVFDYVRERAELDERWRRVTDDLARGTLSLAIDSRFPLADAGSAHRRLESRASAGKILLAVT